MSQHQLFASSPLCGFWPEERGVPAGVLCAAGGDASAPMPAVRPASSVGVGVEARERHSPARGGPGAAQHSAVRQLAGALAPNPLWHPADHTVCAQLPRPGWLAAAPRAPPASAACGAARARQRRPDCQRPRALLGARNRPRPPRRARRLPPRPAASDGRGQPPQQQRRERRGEAGTHRSEFIWIGLLSLPRRPSSKLSPYVWSRYARMRASCSASI